MATKEYDRTTQDVGNIVSFDHINLTVPDQQTAIVFYLVGLGLTRDPYLTIGLENMWVNAGRQQFHLPTAKDAQLLRGQVGLVVPDLEQLQQRLSRVASKLEGTMFRWSVRDEAVEVTCPWGNRFLCTGPNGGFGGTRLGIPYVLLNSGTGTAPGIAQFYRSIMGADADVLDMSGAAAAVVRVGRGQTFMFREDETEQREYDGHHVAVYLANFSAPHRLLKEGGLITQESNEWQYRFTDVVDPETGRVLHQLEHEVRSVHHPMYQRPLVNRDPSVDTGSYTRGADALVLG